VAFTWDVHLPGEDLPRRLKTGYLVSEGETIEIGGREWLIESVDVVDVDDATNDEPVTGTISAIPPKEPPA